MITTQVKNVLKFSFGYRIFSQNVSGNYFGGLFLQILRFIYYVRGTIHYLYGLGCQPNFYKAANNYTSAILLLTPVINGQNGKGPVNFIFGLMLCGVRELSLFIISKLSKVLIFRIYLLVQFKF